MKNIQNESGRSMVEILGVLAIIGVLSVGGIAGYNAAMDRIYANRLLERFNMIYEASMTAYHMPNSYMSCCSYDSISDKGVYLYSGCRDGVDFRSQQLDEVSALLPSDYCPKRFVYKDNLLSEPYCADEERDDIQGRGGWAVRMLNSAARGNFVITFWRLPSRYSTKSCELALQSIIHTPAYAPHIVKLGRVLNNDWLAFDPTDENVKNICAVDMGFSVAFDHIKGDDCNQE